MATVSVAVVSSFHLKHKPSDVERRIALPVGIIFWLLALSCLIAGTTNYAATVTRFSRNRALVQHGWMSHLVRNRNSLKSGRKSNRHILGIHRSGNSHSWSMYLISIDQTEIGRYLINIRLRYKIISRCSTM